MKPKYSELFIKHQSLFIELDRRGLLEKHLESYGIKKHVKIIHSEERTLEIASNYTGTCFKSDYSGMYQHALKNKYLHKLTDILYKHKIIHSEERTLEIARNYTGTNFLKDYKNEYMHSRRHKYFSKLTDILKKAKVVLYSEERTLEIARNYTGTNFTNDYRCEYMHARKNKYSHKLTDILYKHKLTDILYKHKIIHSEERTLEIARNYTGTKFTIDCRCEYAHALRHKYLHKLNEIIK